MARCIQSANIIYKNSDLIHDNRLLEFDYGDAEGLKYEDLINQFPIGKMVKILVFPMVKTHIKYLIDYFHFYAIYLKP